MSEEITFTLHGTNIARCGDEEVKARGYGGPIGPLARLMIERGKNPFADVVVKRGETVCFRVHPLIFWASHHCAMSEASSGSWTVYKPMPAQALQAMT